MCCSAMGGVFGSVGKCILESWESRYGFTLTGCIYKNYHDRSFKEDFIPRFMLLVSFLTPLSIIPSLFSTTKFYLH